MSATRDGKKERIRWGVEASLCLLARMVGATSMFLLFSSVWVSPTGLVGAVFVLIAFAWLGSWFYLERVMDRPNNRLTFPHRECVWGWRRLLLNFLMGLFPPIFIWGFNMQVKGIGTEKAQSSD